MEKQIPEVTETEFEKLANLYSQDAADYFEIEKFDGLKVTVFDSIEAIRAKYKEYTGQEAPSYMKNFSPQNEGWGEVCLLRPGAIDGNGIVRTEEEFKKSLRHEILHTYQKAFYAQENIDPQMVPWWIREGESLYFAGQTTKDPGEISPERVMNIGPDSEDKYTVGLKIVSEIIERFGKEKLFALVKQDQDSLIKELLRTGIIK
jgi:hypothetical protein